MIDIKTARKMAINAGLTVYDDPSVAYLKMNPETLEAICHPQDLEDFVNVQLAGINIMTDLEVDPGTLVKVWRDDGSEEVVRLT